MQLLPKKTTLVIWYLAQEFRCIFTKVLMPSKTHFTLQDQQAVTHMNLKMT